MILSLKMFYKLISPCLFTFLTCLLENLKWPLWLTLDLYQPTLGWNLCAQLPHGPASSQHRGHGGCWGMMRAAGIEKPVLLTGQRAIGKLADPRGHGGIHLMMWWGQHYNGCMSSGNAHSNLKRWILLFHHFMRDEGGTERLSNFPKVTLLINGKGGKSSPGETSVHLPSGGLTNAFQPFSHTPAIFSSQAS